MKTFSPAQLVMLLVATIFSVFVPDATAIPVSNRTGAQWSPTRPDSPTHHAKQRVQPDTQAVDFSKTTPEIELRPTLETGGRGDLSARGLSTIKIQVKKFTPNDGDGRDVG